MVNRVRDEGRLPGLGGHAEHEPTGVQDFHGQSAADLHLLLIEGGVHAGTGHGRAPAHRIGAVTFQDVGGHHHVSLRLAHLLAVRVSDKTRDGGAPPRQRVVLEVGAHDTGEQPGADDVVSLRRYVHGESELEQLLVALPAAGDLWRQRRRGPRVHHIRVCDEPAGDSALGFLVAGGTDRDRVDGEACLIGDDHGVVHRFAVGIQGIPHREGDPEEPLAGDQPVAVQALDPVVIAVPHMLRGPGQLLAAFQEFGFQLLVAAAIGQIPLAGCDDFQRFIALLVEIDGPGDRLRFPVEVAGGAQQLHDRGPGGEGSLAGQLRVRLGMGQPLRGFALQTAITPDHRAGGEFELPPPLNVGQVPEGTAHRDARTLVGFSGQMRQDWDLDPEDRRGDGRAEQLLVAVVVGMGDQRTDTGKQLGAGGLDEHRAACAVEGDAVVGPRMLPRLQLRLGDCCLEGDVPHGGCKVQIGLTTREVA